ncbi:hypothetical protein [Dulcicalothrix desertica]|uniref:hypothetical protein n=1 Tax=Dulcicalothrix desertica TaxID=32056 RepID=UPI000F8D9D2A|nr:hypothetical protein [Dulcicalothrix desertica]
MPAKRFFVRAMYAGACANYHSYSASQSLSANRKLCAFFQSSLAPNAKILHYFDTCVNRDRREIFHIFELLELAQK